jgi:hypothetical protein
MDLLQLLQSLGLEPPTPAYLAGLVLFGIVGMVAWVRGRKQARPATKWLGLALMLYPYAVPQTWLLYLVGTILSAAVAWSWAR